MTTRADITVFGATSFVGQLVVDHLVDRYGNGHDGGLRLVLAGRNRDKLDRLLADRQLDLPVMVADAADRSSLDRLVGSTRVVISTVGPYALYGSDLVAAVAEAGIDYCDLTGEPQWVQRMIDSHGAAATTSGARILHSCGFDSIPSDLGVWYTQQMAMSRLGRYCNRIAMRVKGARGGVSGGTMASALNVLDETSADPSLRKTLTNPYALAPAGQRSGVRQPNVLLPGRDRLSGRWVAPFVMASINTKVVHRTNALLDYRWGRDFRYDEAVMTGRGPVGLAAATTISAGLGTMMGAAAVSPIRSLLRRFVTPGTGPGPATREAGYFDLRFFGETVDGGRIQTRVTGDADPGYGSTSKMLGETAIALLEKERASGGFPTPAVALGDALVGRLSEHAGLHFSVVN